MTTPTEVVLHTFVGCLGVAVHREFGGPHRNVIGVISVDTDVLVLYRDNAIPYFTRYGAGHPTASRFLNLLKEGARRQKVTIIIGRSLVVKESLVHRQEYIACSS